MRQISAFVISLTIAAYWAWELRNWYWWYFWEDDDDEPNPAPFLSSTWKVWPALDYAWFWVQSRLWWPIERWLQANLPSVFPPPKPWSSPADADGRTPEEWLLIYIEGVWNLEHWYKDEYDWQIKRDWDEYLKSHDAANDSETGRPEALTGTRPPNKTE